MADLQTLKSVQRTFSVAFTTSASGMLKFTKPDGTQTTWLDIGDVDWDHITIDNDVTSAAGTTETLDTKLKTCVAPNGTAPTNSTLDAKDAGGTGIAMTQVTTSAAREVKSYAKNTSSGAANIGRYIGIWQQLGGTAPVYSGTLTIYVGR